MTDLYSTLGVKPDADDAEIKSAHRAMVKKHHPDAQGGDREQFENCQKAFEILSDPDRRQHYDDTGSTNDAPDADEMARQIVISTVMEVICRGKDLKHRHIIREAQDELEDALRRAEIDRADYEYTADNLKEAVNRLSRKGEKPNFIARSVQNEADKSARQAKLCDKNIEILTTAISLVQDFDYRVDDVSDFIAMEGSAGTRTSGWGTISWGRK